MVEGYSLQPFLFMRQLDNTAWKATDKSGLIIEVWERLDCESVGAAEIEAIEVVVEDQYGKEAVDSPMVTARRLADEGAYLRHAEIMKLYVARAAKRPDHAVVRGALQFDDLKTALVTLRDLEHLRRKLVSDGERHGLRSLRQAAIAAKEAAKAAADRPSVDAGIRHVKIEIAEWLRIWLQTPEVFEQWVTLRQRSPGFRDKFGHL